MGPRHRRRVAANLPSSRLPVGTQLSASPSDSSRSISRTTNRSSSAFSQRPASSDRDVSLGVDRHHLTTNTASSVMSASIPTLHQVAMSAAEAKLRRQQERIEADALLRARAHAQLTRPVSRAKDKAIRMPISWNISEAQSQDMSSQLRVPEVRINTYHPHHFSRESSMSRSASTVSDHASAAEMARQDSMIDAGFQIFTSARGRKQDPAAYDRKPEVMQKTVEATVDRREIYEVFACDLPGLDFLGQNAGREGGQLQFIQHPNGDVSAHMWDMSRYQWDNIGSFSNIRKKIEGQVSNTRLKGETADQAVQRNSLAYFRVISKQRECERKNLPFGQLEIEALLSKRPKDNKTKTASRHSSVSKSFHSAHDSVLQHTVLDIHGQVENQSEGVPILDSWKFPPQTSHPSAPNPFLLRASEEIGMNNEVDPFITVGPKDKAGASTRRVSALVNKWGAERLNASSTMMNVLSTVRVSPRHQKPAGRQEPSDSGSSVSSIGVSRSKLATPLESRNAMRDQLFKISEAANERTFGQSTARTVMHDPYHVQSSNGSDGLTNSQAMVQHALSRHGVDLTADSVSDTDNPYETGAEAPIHSVFTGVKASDQNANEDWEQELNEWWTSGNKLARQEEFYQSIVALHKKRSVSTPVRGARSIGTPIPTAGLPIHLDTPSKEQRASAPPFNEAMTRILIPVYENLASYVQGPLEQRRDYWCNWSQAPEYAIDRSAAGNNSFFEEEWGQPPPRIGRDPRYARVPGELRFGGLSPGGYAGGSPARGGGRFGYGGGRYS